MKHWQKVAAVAAAVIVVTGGGVAVGRSWQDPEPASAPDAPAAPSTRAFAGGKPSSRFVPITPCRIVDTRLAGGPIASNQSRNFDVSGTDGFVDQGGKTGGCGIPDNGSSAVEVTITAVDAVDGGFLRAYPSGLAEPTATFINYSPFDPSNTGTISLCQGACAGGRLTVKGHGSATDLVIDVQGYYSPPITARIGSDASVVSGSRVTSASSTATGAYVVNFDRDVSECAYSATPSFAGKMVQPLPGNADNRVAVFTYNEDGAFVSSGFWLEVTC